MENLLQKIIAKAYEVNEYTDHTIFLDFSGHVKWLQVKIYIKGWKEKYPDIKKRAYLYNNDAIKQLEDILQELENIERS